MGSGQTDGVTGTDVAPPVEVLRAFGLGGGVHRLRGGRGGSFLVDGAVLKQADDVDEAAWVQALAARVEPAACRLARPLATDDGSWVHAGWVATEHVPGLVPLAPDWAAITTAGRCFADAAAAVPAPSAEALDRRTHRWARADRAAWGEEDVALPGPGGELLEALEDLTSDGGRDRQVVHADLAGNVHLDEDGTAVVLDLSLYVRPVRWGDAVVVADAVTWLEGDPALATAFAGDAEGLDLLARALAFRLVAEQLGPLAGESGSLDPYERILRLLDR